MEDKISRLFKGAGSAIKSFTDGLKWGDSDITPSDVIAVLERIEIRKSQYTSEKNVENIIDKYLNAAFNGRTHKQYSIGGFLHLKIDIDIGDGQVGIEIKLAKELSASNIERLFGQVLYYSKRKYKENLIVLIAGLEKDHHLQVVKEIEAILEEQGVCFYFLKVK